MKKLLIGVCMVFIVAGITAAQARVGGTMYVGVKTLQLKSGTGFFASNRGQVNYGDRVTVVQINGRFMEVRTALNITGWTPTANLSAKQVSVGTSSTATAREVALAGKGFNQDVENSYKTQRNLNYADVDRVETITVSENDLRRFLEEGRLSMGDR